VREALGESARTGRVDQNRSCNGALRFRLRRVETRDRSGRTSQVRFADSRRERRAREIADFVEPAAEAVEKDEALEGGIIVAMKRSRDRADSLDLAQVRDPVEVLIQRAKKRDECVVHVDTMTRKLFAAFLFLVATAAFAHAGHHHHYLGTVTALHDDQVSIHTTDGKDVTFLVSKETVFERGKRSDVTTGTRVSVELALDGKTAAVVKVGATSPH